LIRGPIDGVERVGIIEAKKTGASTSMSNEFAIIHSITSTSLLSSALEIFNPSFVRGWLEGVSLPRNKGLCNPSISRQG